MYDIGRVCIKTAGRDSNRYCVIVEQIDSKYVVVEGQTRRKKVNISHLEPTQKVVDTKDIAKSLADLGISLPKKGEARKASPRPKKQKAKKAQPATAPK